MPNRMDNSYSSYSSDSEEEEEEWSNSHKKSKKKAKHTPAKRPRFEARGNNLEEGEISSDELDDDEDDGLDENLIGGEEDKKMLEKMSEREREEELFKRGERRDAMRARRAVKKKLREKKERERAEKSNAVAPKTRKETSAREEDYNVKRQSAYANVFSSDSDDGQDSDGSLDAGPAGIQSRKQALEKRKEATSSKFQKLIESRKQQQKKRDGVDKPKRKSVDVQSDSESDSSDDNAKGRSDENGSGSVSPKRTKSHSTSRSKNESRPKVASDNEAASSDSSSDSRRMRRKETGGRRTSCSSLSSNSSDDDDGIREPRRGRSRSPVEEMVSSLDQLSKIRMSRYKIERLVHMPFFDNLLKGCFVRLNIGLSHGVPIYRCTQVVDVIESAKIYELDKTRTNKCCVVCIGKDQSTFRLAYVSNAPFLQSEFDSWLRRTTDAGVKLPTVPFVEKKAKEIITTIQTGASDNKMIEQIIQSKRRFQKAPTNFALRKAELLKERELAQIAGDNDQARRISDQLKELESQVERIERRRTMGFKSITTINQRNRILSVKQAEQAIIEEAKLAATSTEEDHFNRTQSKPVIVTKRYLEALRNKRTSLALAAKEAALLGSIVEKPVEKIVPVVVARPGPDGFVVPALPPLKPVQSAAALTAAASQNDDPLHDSLHAIHNFDIQIDIDVGGGGTGSGGGTTGGLMARSASMSALSSMNGAASHMGSVTSMHDVNAVGGISAGTTGVATPNSRRMLNLTEYKKRKGLI